jgi:hypothetical protein
MSGSQSAALLQPSYRRASLTAPAPKSYNTVEILVPSATCGVSSRHHRKTFDSTGIRSPKDLADSGAVWPTRRIADGDRIRIVTMTAGIK